MKKMSVRALLLCAGLGFTLSPVFVLAAPTANPVASASVASDKNLIESVQASQSDGNVVVKITLKQPFAGQIGSFSVSKPPRIAIDLPDTANGLSGASQSLNEGDLRSVSIVQVADRARLVFNLVRPLVYDTRVDGRNVYVTLAMAKNSESTSARFAEPKNPVDQHDIRDIAFRRGKDGEGRIVVNLSDTNTGIDIKRQGSNLVVEFLKTSLPENLRRRLDVTDFSTPVTSIVSSQQGGSVRMVVTPKGSWEHNAYQSDNQFVLEVKSVQEDSKKLIQTGDSRQKYSGEKLSLNFQNIDVRSVLQVIADFTNLNIITSDTVSGALTLRLKDVPWDQALDIILQAKGLDMRRSGNVIWIAPRDELAAKEKLELEAKSQIQELEPVRTETFQVNYHQAKTIQALLVSNKDSNMLSKRGTVSVDERSNKIFVTDVAARLDDVRRLIGEIDVPVRQVLIEAQIVEATDSFSRDIGVRLGGGANVGTSAGGRPRYSVGGGNLNSTGYQAGQIVGSTPSITDALAVNLPAAPASGVAGALSFVLWNSSATRVLDLEISALESDGRGKVVSRPRVMTADQVEAVIEQGVEIPYQEATSSGATSVSFRKANLTLKVKPQITPDGRVFMSLDINKDTPSTTVQTSAGVPIDTKHVKTEVIVENGGTVVIGGIYTQKTSDITNKIPLLGDIPYLGYFFKNNQKKDEKTELMIFITPRVVTDQTLLAR